MPDDDLFEVEELERAAEWRLRKVDVDPTDATSRAAAVRLEVLAGDVRRMRDSPLFREYIAICNWLGESDGIVGLHGHGERLPCQDRRRSFAGERRGLPARSDRSGEADVRRGVKRALSLRGPHRPFGRLRLDETGAASMFTSPTQWERSARSAG